MSGARSDAVYFFMPDSSSLKEAGPFPGTGEEYFLDPDEEEEGPDE